MHSKQSMTGHITPPPLGDPARRQSSPPATVHPLINKRKKEWKIDHLLTPQDKIERLPPYAPPLTYPAIGFTNLVASVQPRHRRMQNNWLQLYQLRITRLSVRPNELLASSQDLNASNEIGYLHSFGQVLHNISSQVFETGPADLRAFGPALAGQAGPVIWKPALRGAGRAYSLKASGPGYISKT
jgi:hypothetical protein